MQDKNIIAININDKNSSVNDYLTLQIYKPFSNNIRNNNNNNRNFVDPLKLHSASQE